MQTWGETAHHHDESTRKELFENSPFCKTRDVRNNKALLLRPIFFLRDSPTINHIALYIYI